MRPWAVGSSGSRYAKSPAAANNDGASSPTRSTNVSRPNTAPIVISVMRDEFTPGEIRNLLPFVRWARRLNAHWQPTNPVVLLTGVEPFHEIGIESTWRNRGGPYERFADYDTTRSLHRFAEATQVIHLELPLFAEDQRVAEERRRRRFEP